jgi:hypothetical protein
MAVVIRGVHTALKHSCGPGAALIAAISEPNGAFQAACYLGAGVDALGFISRPIIVKLQTREVTVAKVVNGTPHRLADPIAVQSLQLTGVNRNVIRCVGDEIRVNVNGQDVARVRDDTFQRGVIGYGAGTWSNPTTINFDNILVTSAGGRA